MYQRLKQLREQFKFTQEEIANKLNCSQRVYSNYERGERDLPTDILIGLAKIYKTSTDYILNLTDNLHIKTKHI